MSGCTLLYSVCVFIYLLIDSVDPGITGLPVVGIVFSIVGGIGSWSVLRLPTTEWRLRGVAKMPNNVCSPCPELRVRADDTFPCAATATQGGDTARHRKV